MQKNSIAGWSALATGCALIAASLTLAQAPKPPVEGEIKIKTKPGVRVDGGVEVRQRENVQVKEKVVHHEHHFIPHRSSELIGMHIHAVKGGDVGLVKDMVVDCMTGQVRYVVVSFTEFGVEQKLFAMPWEMFECKPHQDTHVLFVDITEQQILKAPSFTVNAWPDFTDVAWVERNDVFFRENFQFRTRAARRDVDVDVDVRNRDRINRDRRDVDVDVDVDRDRPRTDRPRTETPRDTDRPRTDTPRTDTPRTGDTPRSDDAPKPAPKAPKAPEPKAPEAPEAEEPAPKAPEAPKTPEPAPNP